MIENSEADADHKRVSSARLDAILGLCETTECRRVRLLDYFAESGRPCGNCDNCLYPPEEWDATDCARKLLSCIFRCEQASGFAFGAQQTIDVLRGKSTPKVQQFGHDRLSTFGIGKDLDVAQWRSLLRQLVMLRLVKVDHERFNTLRLTPESREVLRGERQLKLRRPTERARPKKAARRGGLANSGRDASASAAGDGVFEALRTWRREVAKQHGVPAYTVFHDSTLHELAAALPDSPGQLRSINGIGAAKFERYAEALLEIIRQAAQE
jgi:ATP-dependent DNA helicase RecQ